MGAAPEIAKAMQETSPTLNFEVLEENWEVVALFMKLQTQWVPSMGGVIGLNYQSVLALFTIERIQNQSEMLADLQTMEIAALQVMNAKD